MPAKIKKGAVGSIDMTPMIDVVFQLMIFFLVATRLDEAEREFPVSLPTASEAKPFTSKPTELFINIDRTGRYFVQGRFITVEELEDLLRQSAANNPTQTVRIRGDEESHLRYLVAAINATVKAGIRDYRIDTAIPEGG
ncbi:MAG: biopolymer transporter ExbD [Pirellulales bacterium]